jgi:hypothetical protein
VMSSLSRVEFFVEDRKLGTALRALVGVAHGAPTVTPVINAEAKPNGHIEARGEGTTEELLAIWLSANGYKKGAQVVARNIKEFNREHGKSEKSATYVLKKACEAGLMRRMRGTAGSTTTYVVL